MKLLILSLILFSQMVFGAENCRDVSATCLGATKSFMTKKDGEKYCANVATNCFRQHIRQDGFYGARDKCLNVSATCYDDVRELAGSNQAIVSCSDVSTRCYQYKRSQGKDVKSSIQSCYDVYSPCRTCFKIRKKDE